MGVRGWCLVRLAQRFILRSDETPNGIRINVFEILAMAGMVEWKDTYQVRFPKQSTVTEMQQVELDNKKADTLLKVAQSKSQIGGDEIELRSALDDVGLNDIELESVPDIDINEE